MNYTTKTTNAKAWVAAFGATLTALTTALAAVSLALSDDTVDLAEVAGLVTAALTLGATIYGVWRTPNRVVSPEKRLGQEPRDQSW